MKCDQCGSDEASVHLTQILDGRQSDRHLCLRCAARETGADEGGDVREILKAWVVNQAERNKPPGAAGE
jgi:protein arginine kinase activator